MKNLRSIICLFLLMGPLYPPHTHAADPYKLFQDANQAYMDGAYSYAAELYEQVLSLGMESAALYYNLGNAYFKQSMLALAILNYERARLIKPFDENILYNLEIARSKTTDRIDTLPLIFYKRWWQRFMLSQSIDGWAKMGIIFLSLLLAAALWYFFSKTQGMKKLGFFLALTFMVISLSCFFAAYKQYIQHYSRTQAIVMNPRVTIKSAPGETSPDLFVIHEGTKLSITNELGEWVEIRLENGNQGWLRKNSIIAIRAYDAETP